MNAPEKPSDDEPMADWEEFDQTTDLIVTDDRTPKDQPRDPVKSR